MNYESGLSSKMKEVAFGEIVELITNKVNALEISLNNYISTDNMLPNCGGITHASSFPSANKFNAFHKTDTLFSNIRTYFRKVWFARFSGGASADVLIFRSKNNSFLDPHFLYYLTSSKTFIDYTDLTSKGAKMPRGDKDAIAKFSVKLPPINEQKAIASVLGALDDMIENNRRMNETLEEMARAIFKSWFVDFDPVHAKAAGKTPAHMDAETAALFPSTFGDDGLPLGWAIGKIEDIVDRQRAGKLFNKKTVHEEGTVPVLDQSAADIIGYHNEEPSVLASPSDRVITFANHTCVLRLIDFNFSAIQNVIPFKGKNYPTEWVLFASHNKQSFEEYKGHWPTFMVQPVIAPDDDTSSAFAKMIEPMVSKISTNLSQNQTLAELRDALLPKLMSGEIRVKDAEREVEAIA